MKNIVILLSVLFVVACTNQNDSQIQTNDAQYREQPIITDNSHTDALVTGAVAGATGYALAKYSNKPRYSNPKASYSKPVVVINKHYYQTKPKVRVSRYKRK